MTDPHSPRLPNTSAPAAETSHGLPAVPPAVDAVSGTTEPAEHPGSLPTFQPLAEAKSERVLAFAGYSLRAGLANSAEMEEAVVQCQLGHASAEMTRRYQRRRERFRVTLTKASGL